LKIFLDTANIDEIRQAASLGVLDGVTTNPSLVSKEPGEFRDLLREICSIVDGPVSAEAVSTDTEGMLREGRELARIHKNIVVKIPMLPAGLRAIHQLKKEGIRTNCTLIFTPNQALLAAKAGAAMVSPFIGRLDDVSATGMDVIRDISAIFSNYDFETEILTASVRHPVHVIEAALAGSDIVTMPYKVLEQMCKHPLTDLGIERFLADWEKVKARAKAPAIAER
jgi:transaldolase